jgi:hypothetical protein
LRVAGSPAAWASCGFAVRDGQTAVGTVRLRFQDGDGGVVGWSLRDLRAAELDGLPTERAQAPPPHPTEHPNGAVRIDHLVAFTDELARSIAALEAGGLSLRRVREPEEPGPPLRQAFFRLGEVILELVESPQAKGARASFWGITFAVGDLDQCAELLGERLGEIRDAVQPGRRIATVRGSAGLGLPVALISA